MVILITTKDGYNELEPLILAKKHPVWIASNVLAESEVQNLRQRGVDLTTYDFDAITVDCDSIKNCIEDISLHHPNTRIWIEYTGYLG